MITDSNMVEQVASSQKGRDLLLSHIATTENAAVLVLDEVLKDLKDPKLIKMAKKHRADEVRHATMLSMRMDQLGIPKNEEQANASLRRLGRLYETLNPQTIAEKYAVIQIIEEQDAPLFEELADAIRPHDLRTAEIFARMAVDEASHIHYCRVITKDIPRGTLERYREVNKALLLHPNEVEVYSQDLHFGMIQSWTENRLDVTQFGNGLIIPGLCCGFVDGIGATKTAYFYGLKTNPAATLVARGRAILRLAPRIIQAARDAGYTSAVTSTSNSVVERFWVEKLGFVRNGESVLMGAL
jgi:hypothetical protein